MQTIQNFVDTYFDNSETGGAWLPHPDYCFTNTAGTTPAGDGDLVARINDLTGNNRHATQSNAANQMRLVEGVDGRWYFDPQDRNVWYEFTRWDDDVNYTVATAYVARTTGDARRMVAFGRSTSSGRWRMVGAESPSAFPERIATSLDGSAVWSNGTHRNDLVNLDVVAAGLSAPRTTYSAILCRQYNARLDDHFAMVESGVTGEPTAKPDISILFRASTVYNRAENYGVVLRGAETSQSDLDDLLEFLAEQPWKDFAGDLAFTTAPTVTDRSPTSYTLQGTLSEQGQVHAVAIPHSDPVPSVAQIVAGQRSNGSSAPGSGSTSTTSVGAFTLTVSGSNVANAPSHDIHYVGRAPE